MDWPAATPVRDLLDEWALVPDGEPCSPATGSCGWRLTRSVRDGVRLRLHTLVDVAGLDEQRTRDWVVVRVVVNALRRLQETPGTRRTTSTGEHLTRCVTIAKSVQD